MSLLKKDTNEEEIFIIEGKNALDHNKFFTLLNYLMNNIIFRSFFDEYFRDWDQTKTTLMFLKTYQAVDMNISKMEYETKRKYENREEMIVGIMKKLIDNGETRRKIVESMNNFLRDDFNLEKDIKLSLE